MTEIYDWKNGIDQNELEKCANCIKKGGIIIFPTDTVYGIGCNVWNEEAIKKVFEIKDRNYNKPMNVLCSGIKDIQSLAEELTEKEKEIIQKYMPGACTLILHNKKKEVSDILRAGLTTVAVRIPDHDIAIELIRKCGFPIVASSANISGTKDGIEIKDILQEFENKVDIIIDGGKSKIGIPSTIVEIEQDKIKVLRKGSVEISDMKNL